MGKPKMTLSIDIGCNKIKIVEGEQKKNGIVLMRSGELQTPLNALEKERIKDVTALTSDLTGYLTNEKFTSKNLVITINAVGSLISEVDIPKTDDEKEVRAIIANEMIHSYNADPNSVIQYKKIETFLDQSNAQFDKYRVVVLDAEFVDGYYTFVNQLHLKPIAMDININAMEKLFGQYPVINDQSILGNSVMIVDYGAGTTTISIYADGKQKVFRHLTFGSKEIETTVADELLVAVDEVRALKEDGYNFVFDANANESYYTVLKPYFLRLTEELQNIMRYYSNRFDSAVVSQIYLTGGGSKLFGLTKFLHDNLNLPVNRIKKLSNENNDVIPDDIVMTHLNAIGALIRY